MMDQIKTLFHANEPEIALESAGLDGSELRLLLRDCDGYRLGTLVFSEVQLVCLTTQWETFESISTFGESELPNEFAWLREGIAAGYRLYRFIRSEDEDDESVLPLFGESRQAFIVAKSIRLTSALEGR